MWRCGEDQGYDKQNKIYRFNDNAAICQYSLIVSQCFFEVEII
jgi:hypothetical protein